MVTDSPPVSPGSALARHRWDNEPDRTAATEPGRRSNIARWEPIVDPHGILPPDERTELARRAFYQDLGRRSGEARRARRAQQTTVRTLDEVVDQLIANAPAITDEQRAKLQTLLTPTR